MIKNWKLYIKNIFKNIKNILDFEINIYFMKHYITILFSKTIFRTIFFKKKNGTKKAKRALIFLVSIFFFFFDK